MPAANPSALGTRPASNMQAGAWPSIEAILQRPLNPRPIKSGEQSSKCETVLTGLIGRYPHDDAHDDLPGVAVSRTMQAR